MFKPHIKKKNSKENRAKNSKKAEPKDLKKLEVRMNVG